MSVGTGIECINLKKAKYNRDMRMAKAAAEAAKAAATESKTYTHTTNSEAVAPKARPVRNDTIPADNGITLKDIIGVFGEQLSASFLNYRKQKMRERANAPKYITKKVKAKTAFPVSVLGYIVVFSVIAMFLVIGNSKISEATLYAGSLKKEISATISECEKLTAEVNSRNDAASVEDYALNVLGLVKKTDVAKTYVSISGEDKVVVSGSGVEDAYKDSAFMTLDSGN